MFSRFLDVWSDLRISLDKNNFSLKTMFSCSLFGCLIWLFLLIKTISVWKRCSLARRTRHPPLLALLMESRRCRGEHFLWGLPILVSFFGLLFWSLELSICASLVSLFWSPYFRLLFWSPCFGLSILVSFLMVVSLFWSLSAGLPISVSLFWFSLF